MAIILRRVDAWDCSELSEVGGVVGGGVEAREVERGVNEGARRKGEVWGKFRERRTRRRRVRETVGIVEMGWLWEGYGK